MWIFVWIFKSIGIVKIVIIPISAGNYSNTMKQKLIGEKNELESKNSLNEF